MASRFQTLIVDDEPLGRERVRVLLEQHEAVVNVGECENGREAVKAIRTLKPDLVFLDIQMPELDGFGVIREIGAARMPHVIFVTAYDQHALQAFSVHALDYLLKPFDVDRFNEAVARAIRHMETRGDMDFAGRIDALIHNIQMPPRWLDRVLVKTSGRHYFVLTNDVDWIEATGNYVTLHASGKKHLVRQTMANIERQLDPDRFLRIHRSAIVNIDRVKELRPTPGGEHEVLLIDGSSLTLSRSYKNVFDRFTT